nr:cytochrome c [Dechloromonas sp.]
MRRSLLFVLLCLSPCLLGGVQASAVEGTPVARPAPAAKAKPGRAIAVKPASPSWGKQGKAVAAKPVLAAGGKPAPKSEQNPVAVVGVAAVIGKDERELVPMPWQARVAVRAEMRELTVALDEVMKRLVAGKVEEAGEIALDRMGVPVWGAHQKLPKPARPEQYMPEAMRRMALEGYRAASDFATVARTGDRETAIAMLPMLTGSCANCHQSYRIR